MPGSLQPPFSWSIVLTLLAVFGASAAVFAELVRRCTSRRRWVSLSEWARNRRMKVARRELTDLPRPLELLSELTPRVRLRVADAQTTIVQFQTTEKSDAPSSELSDQVPRWNVLIRRVGQDHMPAGLRPGGAPVSIIDFFGLTPFHSLSTTRFSVLAANAKTARHFVRSSAGALLPQDIGLLVCGEYVLLDFSTRPFDPVELDRLMAVAEQVSLAV